MSQNKGCFVIDTLANSKQETAIEWLLIQHDDDMCVWQEVGVAFHKVPAYAHMSERIH